jgi:hypothetical protein
LRIFGKVTVNVSLVPSKRSDWGSKIITTGAVLSDAPRFMLHLNQYNKPPGKLGQSSGLHIQSISYPFLVNLPKPLSNNTFPALFLTGKDIKILLQLVDKEEVTDALILKWTLRIEVFSIVVWYCTK